MRAKTVMGYELEYGLVVIDRNGVRIDERGLDLFESTAPAVGPHLPWAERGIAMPNAARCYRDGTGARMELATAEVRSPAELVAQVEAGHRFMCRVARLLAEHPQVKAVTLSANTIDYSSHPGTAGCHENYFVPFLPLADDDSSEDDGIPF